MGPVAGAALVALIGYGVATSASSSSAPKVAPITSTTLAPTTTLPTPTTVPPPLVPYYAADPPRQYSVEFAGTQEPELGFDPPGDYQLWATPGSTATSGSWFSIESYSSGMGQIYAIDAYRVQIGGQSIAIAHSPTGQTIAQFSTNGSAGVTLTSLGRSDDDLIRLAQSLRFEQYADNVTLTDSSLLDGYEQIGSVSPWFAVQGLPVHQIFYTAGNDFTSSISVVVAVHPPTNQDGDAIDRQVALRFFLDHTTPFSVDGHSAVAGAVVGQRDYALATWTAGDHIVTVSAMMSVPEIIAVARTVHEVSSQEWEGMQLQAAQHSGDNNFGRYEETEPVAVSFGTDADAKPWTITVSTATFSTQATAHLAMGHAMDSASTAGDRPAINTVVDGTRTYVLANLPRAVAPTAQLQVTRPGLDPVVVPFIDADPELNRTFAAYAFSEPTQYSAQIIGADGAVLGSLAAVKTEPSPEIVEMIDDEGDAFADRVATRTSSDAVGGLRWVGPAAAVALMAVVGYGVVSSAVSSHSEGDTLDTGTDRYPVLRR